MSHEKALSIMREGRGAHFDPDIIDVFLDLAEEFRRIAQRFVDSDADMARKEQDMVLAKGDGSFCAGMNPMKRLDGARAPDAASFRPTRGEPPACRNPYYR